MFSLFGLDGGGATLLVEVFEAPAFDFAEATLLHEVHHELFFYIQLGLSLIHKDVFLTCFHVELIHLGLYLKVIIIHYSYSWNYLVLDFKVLEVSSPF